MWPFARGKRASTKADAAGNNEKGKDGGEDRLLQEFGVTDRLLEFVKTFTADTFKSFPLQDDGGKDSASDALSNVRKDLTEWQEQHATLVLSKVKEIAQLRYVLCPRHLKERQFWGIYFQLVKSYVAPYEMHAIQKARMKILEMNVEGSLGKAAVEVEMAETISGGGTYTISSKQNEEES